MRSVAIILIVSIFTLASSTAFAQEAGDWHKVAVAIPLGAKVRVHTKDGQRITGTLMRVDEAAMQVKRNTRRPEAAMTVAFENIANMQRDGNGGLNWGQALGIGVAAGAGAILTIFMMFLSFDGS